MKTPAPADLQRWSEEVARDPASLSFLPLARAYRRQGRRDAAIKLCLRGLEQHPTHVDAHGLLAVLYFESGQRSKAYDEWSTVLRLEADNFEALRGMGFYHLEQNDDATARRHIERANTLKPGDPAVQEALRMLRERAGEIAHTEPLRELDPWEKPHWATSGPQYPPPGATTAGQRTAGDGRPTAPRAPDRFAFTLPDAHHPPAPRTPGPVAQPSPLVPDAAASPPAATPAIGDVGPGAEAAGNSTAPPPSPSGSSGAEATSPSGESEPPANPSQLFDSLLRGGQVIGALVLDSQGLVLAGSLTGEKGSSAEAIGAILGGAIEEAVRTAMHLRLGEWKGIVMEAEEALLHLAPVKDGVNVLVAAHRDVPVGWVVRAAGQANVLAARFLEVYT